MADTHRTRRSKVIDYSKFGGIGVDDDDDDFSSLTPPVVKKPKKNSKVKTKAEITEKKDVIVKKKERIRIERKLPEEKEYEDHIKIALELSMQKENDPQMLQSPNVTVEAVPERDRDLCGDIITSDDAVRAPDKKAEEKQEHQKSNDSKKGVKRKSDTDDMIEVLETGVEEDCVEETGRRGRRRSASKVKKYIDDDDDFDSGSNKDVQDFKMSGTASPDDSESDFSGADSDYEEAKPKTKKAKTKPAATQRGKAKHTNSSAHVKSVSSNQVKESKPKLNQSSDKKKCVITPALATTHVSSCRTPTMSRPLGTALKKQSWTPPGSAGSNKSPFQNCVANMTSPGGGIRLGLSRRAQVKHLHPNVKVGQ